MVKRYVGRRAVVAGIISCMVLWPTGPAHAWLSAADEPVTTSGGPSLLLSVQGPTSQVMAGEAKSAHGRKPTVTRAPAAVMVAAGQLTAVAVGLRPTGIVGSTPHTQRPNFVVALPAGLDFLRVSDDLDHGVTGRWDCRQDGRDLTCELANGSLAGRIPGGRLAQAIVILRAGTSVSGAVQVSASASGTAPSGARVPLAASTSLPVKRVREVPPTVLIRDRGAPIPSGDRNAISLSVGVLGPLAAAAPSVRLGSLAPSRSRDILVTAPDFRCTSGNCESRNAMPLGSVSRVDVSFVAAGTSAAIRWEPRATYVSDPRKGADDVSAIIPVRQTRNLLEGPNFDVSVLSPLGQSIRQGGPLSMSLRVTNQSADPHAPSISLALPTGVTATEQDPAWSCARNGEVLRCSRGPLASGLSSDLAVSLRASSDAPPGAGRLHLRETTSGTKASHPIAVLDIGDPAAGITVLAQTDGTWREWNDGSQRDLEVGVPETIRVRLDNIGGDVLRAGGRVQLDLDAGTGVTMSSATTSRGACAISDGALRCTLRAPFSIAPGASVGSIDVTFTPREVSASLDVGDLRANVVPSGAAPTRRSLNYRAVQPLAPIDVRTSDVGPFTQTGSGGVTATLTNDGRMPLRGLELIGILPAGFSLATAVNDGEWTCETLAGDVRCLYPEVLAAGAAAPSVAMDLRVRKGVAAGNTAIQWVATSGGNEYAFGRTSTKVHVRPLASLTPSASPSVVTPRVNADPTSPVTLRSGIKKSGDQGWTHTWRQMCLTSQERALPVCQGASAIPAPPVTVGSHTTTALIPTSPSTRQTFVYEVAATDGSATVRRSVSVDSAPPAASPAVTDLPSYVVSRVPAATVDSRITSTPRAVASGGPAVDVAGAPLISVATGASVSLSASATGAAPFTYSWSQVLGSAVTVTGDDSPIATFTAPSSAASLAFEVTVTDANGLSTVAQVAVTVGAALPSGFCTVYNDALKAQGTLTSALGGGVTAVFSNLKVVGTACQAGASFSFSGGTVSLGDFTITGVTGTATPGGIAISAGNLSAPSSWDAGALSLDDAGLALLWTTSGSSNSVSMVGSFTIPDLLFLPLPSSWAASTQVVASATSSGTSQLAVDAQAAGPNNGLATFASTVSSDGTFSLTVTADNLVYVGNAGVDATGTVQQQTAGGSVTGSVTGSLASTATLVSGVTIPSLSVTWTPGGDPVVAASGSVAFAVGSQSLVVNAQMDYSGPSSWAVTVTGGGTAVWQPLSGLQVPASGFSGSFTYASSGYSWDISATAPNPWSPTGALTIDDIEISMSNSCPSTVSSEVTCPTADVYLALAATAAVDSAPVDEFSATIDAVIGMGGGGGFAMSGALDGSVDIADGLTLTSASITATYQVSQDDSAPNVAGTTENGYSVAAIGDMTIDPVGNLAQVQATVTSAGWTVAAFVDGISFGGSATEFGEMSSSVVAYSSFATTLTPPTDYGLPATIPLAAGETYVSGTYAAPGWFLSATDMSSLSMTGTIEIDPSDGSYSAVLDAAINETIPTGSNSTSIEITELQFALQDTQGQLVISAQGDAVLDLAAGYGASPPQLDLGMSYDLSSNTVSGYFTLDDSQGWDNAFGDNGLTLFELTVQLSLNLDTLTPAVGLSAVADIPEDLSGPFQVPSSAPISAFIDLSLDTPCIGVSIGTQGAGEPTVLIVADGVITASFVDFYVAPDGCTIGSQVYAPGFALDFTGAVLGVGVDIDSSLTFSPTTFMADVTVDSFQVGPLLMDQTTVDVNFVDGGDDSVAFAGGFELFGTDVTASGGLEIAGSTTSGNLDVQTNGFTVEGFSMTNVDVSLAVTDAAGKVTIDFAGSGDIAVLQDNLDVEEFDFVVTDNVISSITADVTDTLTMDNGIAVSGAFNVQYAASPESFAIAASASVAADSFTLASATLALNSDCASLTGSLDVPGVVTASMSGYVVYGSSTCTITDPETGASQTMPGSEGDFLVQASVSGISVADFSGAGCVMLTNISGQDQASTCPSQSTASSATSGTPAQPATTVTVPNVTGLSTSAAQSKLASSGLTMKTESLPVFGVPTNTVLSQTPAAGTAVSPGSAVTVTVAVDDEVMPFAGNAETRVSPRTSSTADVSGSIEVSLVLGTQDVNNSIVIDGEFQPNGYFSFTGSDTLDIGGFDLDATVTASNSASGASVSAQGGFDLIGNQVTFTGSFSNVGGKPSTSMSASVDPLEIDGFDLGSGSIALDQTSSSFGMSFAMDLQAGSAVSMKANVTFQYVNSSTTLFYVYTSLSMSIPDAVSVSISGSFSNCSSPSCTGPGSISLYVSGSFSYGNWSYSTPSFGISSGGGYNFSTSASQSGQSTPSTDVAGVHWWTGNDSWNTSLSVSQSSISASAGGQATIYSQESPIPYPCGPWYAVWEKTCYANQPTVNWGTTGASASANPWSFCFTAFGSPTMCL